MNRLLISYRSQTPHPFIAILSLRKAKQAIPRIFNYIDLEQRVTILTMIIISLHHLDVIKEGRYTLGMRTLPLETRKKIDNFGQSVLPSLLGYISEAPLNIITGLLGILLDRVDVFFLSQTQVGLAFLTMFASRAEIIKQAGEADEDQVYKWTQTYDKLFALLEDRLLEIFPPHSAQVDDMYVWQFLASMAVGANMQQQQKMVEAVK
jgi:DNA topoisomerase 2-associated protein PAT1